MARQLRSQASTGPEHGVVLWCTRPPVGRVSWGESGPEGQRETEKPGNRDPVLSSADAVP